jgi:hypothetical protein
MQDPETFMAAEWDLHPHHIWIDPEGGGYPVLFWQVPPEFGQPDFAGGKGDPNDPYLISTAEELNNIGHNPRLMNSHFKLIIDLDLTDCHFYEIGSYDYQYCGVFDGNGHAISNLTIEGGYCSGLFGYLGERAEVQDLGIVDANISGPHRIVGGLAGENRGSIKSCYSTGTVVSGSYVGGLVGFNEGSITTSYSTGSVTGNVYVGGLVGMNRDKGSITSSYSSSTVRGDSHVGGLVGSNSGSITSSFWDVETSGLSSSDGGIGRTTAEMQTASTFLNAGWDFIDETDNGTNDIWWIDEGQDYPRLWWEPQN